MPSAGCAAVTTSCDDTHAPNPMSPMHSPLQSCHALAAPRVDICTALSYLKAQSRSKDPHKATSHEQVSGSQRYPQEAMYPFRRHLWEVKLGTTSRSQNKHDLSLRRSTNHRSLNSFALSCSKRNDPVNKSIFLFAHTAVFERQG